MSFKTVGFKTKYIEECGWYIYNEYTIYCAIESVSDVCVYKLFDDSGNEKEIIISAEYDTDYGNRSLIDCLFYLKQHKDKHYQNKDWDIIIERMSDEEMKTIYNNQ